MEGSGEFASFQDKEFAHLSTKELFLRLLRLDHFPVSPEELPDRIVLPPQALGNLEQAILETSMDGFERSQNVHWNQSKSQFEHGRVYKGSRKNTGRIAALAHHFTAYFGNKPFLTYHTHPSGVWYFSVADIDFYKALPRGGFICMAASNKGISAIVQTERTSRIALSADYEASKTKRHLKKEGFEEGILDPGSLARMLSKEGYGYYLWKPPSGIVQSGSLRFGLTLPKADTQSQPTTHTQRRSPLGF